MYSTNDASAWQLPDDWTTSTVEITEVVTREIVVAHPVGAQHEEIVEDAHQRFVQSSDVDDEFGPGEVDALDMALGGEEFDAGADRAEPEWSSRAAELRGARVEHDHDDPDYQGSEEYAARFVDTDASGPAGGDAR